jgi:TatA/E family protein of Tat protein translocase
MFGSVGAPELILIFIVALLVFGPRKLPELGRALGKGISEFRKATSDLKTTLEREMAAEEAPDPARSLSSDAAPAPPTDSGSLDGGDGDHASH